MTTATSGAGIVDGYSGLVDSITSDSESEGEKVVDVALSATGAVIDTIGVGGRPVRRDRQRRRRLAARARVVPA